MIPRPFHINPFGTLVEAQLIVFSSTSYGSRSRCSGVVDRGIFVEDKLIAFLNTPHAP